MAQHLLVAKPHFAAVARQQSSLPCLLFSPLAWSLTGSCSHLHKEGPKARSSLSPQPPPAHLFTPFHVSPHPSARAMGNADAGLAAGVTESFSAEYQGLCLEVNCGSGVGSALLWLVHSRLSLGWQSSNAGRLRGKDARSVCKTMLCRLNGT